jgi:hypothetical protein
MFGLYYKLIYICIVLQNIGRGYALLFGYNGLFYKLIYKHKIERI